MGRMALPARAVVMVCQVKLLPETLSQRQVESCCSVSDPALGKGRGRRLKSLDPCHTHGEPGWGSWH